MESSETEQEQKRKVVNNDVISHFERRLLQKPSTTAKLALPMLRLGNRTKFTIAMCHSRFHRKRIFRGVLKLTPKQGNLLFAVIMVGFMTFIITGLNTFMAQGYSLNPFVWLKNWLSAYLVALPIMIVFSPKVRAWINARVKS